MPSMLGQSLDSIIMDIDFNLFRTLQQVNTEKSGHLLFEEQDAVAGLGLTVTGITSMASIMMQSVETATNKLVRENHVYRRRH